MKGYLAKSLLLSAMTVTLALPLRALAFERGASFLPKTTKSEERASEEFSGFAGALTTQVQSAELDPAQEKPLAPVQIDTKKELGSSAWNGAPNLMAGKLLAIIAPGYSPVINKLVEQLLAASPPSSENIEMDKTLTSERIQKLVEFGASEQAWRITISSNLKLIGDAAMLSAAAHGVASNSASTVCEKAPEISKSRNQADWQKILIACLFQTKNTKSAQVALDVMRAQSNRDQVFIDIADQLLKEGEKKIPYRITPLSAETMSLLKMYDMPLPGELYSRPQSSLIPALVKIPSKRSETWISLAEKALSKGLAKTEDVENVYRSIKLPLTDTASPLMSSQSGMKLRALLFTAAEKEASPFTRLALTEKFIRSSPPALLGASGQLLYDMLKEISPDATLVEKAPTAIQTYMLAGKSELTVEWLKYLKQNNGFESILSIWPQLALSGFVSDSEFKDEFDLWINDAIKKTDKSDLSNIIGSTLLLLDAAGLKIPDTAWSYVLDTQQSSKKFAFSPLLFNRMTAASAAGRMAETILLASALVGEKEPPVPVSIAITKALRQAGLREESTAFAREAIISINHSVNAN